jgi:hypothetical protein
VEIAGRIDENAVRVSERAEHLAMGRGQRPNRAAHAAADDEQLWRQAYEDAVKQGAGPNVARVFANQTLAYERAERDGVELPGAHDFQAYR